MAPYFSISSLEARKQDSDTFKILPKSVFRPSNLYPTKNQSSVKVE